MKTKLTSVLHITNGYPTATMPEYCVFTKEQINAVSARPELSTSLIFINALDNGKLSYVRAIPEIILKSRRAEVIHCFHGLTYILLRLISLRRPIVVSFLNAIENEYNEASRLKPFLIWLTYWLLRRTNTVAIFKDRVPSGIPCKSFHLPNGVDMEKFSIIDRGAAKKHLGLDLNQVYILFVSSKSKFREQKRYDRFKATLDLLRERGIEVSELCLVGQKREIVPYYFSAASVHLLTSDFEGSPNSVKESLSCGTPVVATDVGNVKEMMPEQSCSFVAGTFSPSELADLVSLTLNSECDRDGIRSSLSKMRLGLSENARHLSNIYKQLAEPGRRRY